MKERKPYRKVLVTGASGLIGSRIVPILEKSYPLKLTDLSNSDNTSLPFVTGDLCNPGDVERMVEDVDAVVHLAIAPYRKYKDADNNLEYNRSCIDINVGGTYNLFTAACEAGVKTFVYISSLTVIMGDSEAVQLSDKLKVNPKNVYACSKVFGEHLGQFYSRKYGARFTCLRLGDPFPKPNISRERYVEIRDSGDYLPIFVGFEDIAQSVDCGLQYEGEPFSTFSIVSDNQSDYLDLDEYPKLNYKPSSIALFDSW